MNHRGFTLTEVMVAMAITTILMAGIYGVFAAQQRIRADQRQMVAVQQNLRSTLSLLQAEIRMAGFDPTWRDGGRNGRDQNRLTDGIDNDCDGRTDLPDDVDEDHDRAGIVKAGPHRIQIRLDRDGNADFCGSRELVEYGFSGAADRNGDGIADAGGDRLSRGFKNRALNQPIGEDLQAVAFAYGFVWDGPAGWPDGEIDTDADSGGIIWAADTDGDGRLDTALDTDKNGRIEPADDTNGDGMLNDRLLVHPVPLKSIRAVQVWLLGRTSTPVYGYASTATVVVGSRILNAVGNNGHRWMLLTGIAVCRNLGLR